MISCIKSFYVKLTVHPVFIYEVFDLLQALDRKGGILIFITDGKDTSDDSNHKWPNPKLEERIIDENVRVITLAIG